MADKGNKATGAKKSGVLRNVWFWVAIVAVILWLVSLGGENKTTYERERSATEGETEQEAEAEKPGGKIELKNESVQQQHGFTYIMGEVENKTGKKVFNVGGAATLYDKEGKVAGPEIFNTIVDWFKKLPGRIWFSLKFTVYFVAYWVGYMYGYLTEWIPKTIDSVVEWFAELPGRGNTRSRANNPL